jgi:hypothetical protein
MVHFSHLYTHSDPCFNCAFFVGYFLNELLSGLAAWQKNPELYRKEAIGRDLELRGWVLKGQGARGETLTESDFLSHENFKVALHKWHGMILSVSYLFFCSLSEEDIAVLTWAYV